MKVNEVKIGGLILGSGHPVRVQSMTNTLTADHAATSDQIKSLIGAGVEIIRLAVSDMDSVASFSKIRSQFPNIPLVADVHFDHRLALESIKAGVDKVRINPGNIGSDKKVSEICAAAKDKGIPLRIGVNGGSLPKDIEAKFAGAGADALLAAAERELLVLEKNCFDDIVVSMKSSSIPVTVEANRLFRARHPFPLHIGITEAGLPGAGTVSSAVGIGILLYEGIGETLRVSLTGDPVIEVIAGWQILSALELRSKGIRFISCPTCGRTEIPVEKLALEAQRQLGNLDMKISVAIMGCVVNGPGEARHADIGITGSSTEYVIFNGDNVLDKFSTDLPVPEVIKRLKKHILEM